MAERTQDLSEQAQREARFFDTLYAEHAEASKAQNYLIPDEIVRQIVRPGRPPLHEREYASSLIGDLAGKKVLDYGAGDGWNAICLAKGKAKVWAIDISEVGVELIKKKAAANGVSDLVVAEVQDCYKTKFADNSFDAIYGGGVIHHLQIDQAGLELNRIMSPGGIGVFCEPIRETSLTDYIKAVVVFVTRAKTEDLSEDEDVLTLEKIQSLRKFFRVVNCKQFIVFSAANKLIRAKAIQRLLLWTDYMLMKIPWFARMGRLVVIEVREPIKSR